METRYYIKRDGEILSNNQVKFVYELFYEDAPARKYTAVRVIDKKKGTIYKDKDFDYFEELYYKALAEE